MAEVDLGRPQRIHLVGIGGAGMSAIATVLTAMGHVVTGSDLKRSPPVNRLEALGVPVHIGHRADAIDGAELVGISTAIPPHNEEVVAARERHIEVVRRADLLAAITRCRRTVAVGGTHGKTTTTSMLALALVEGGMHPSFIVGGDINEVGTGAAWDDGEWLVVEADESDGTFLRLGPEAVVVTSVEPDHLDYFGDVETMVAGFDEFVASAPGPRVVCADDPGAAALAARHAGVTYGLSEAAAWRMVDVRGQRAGVSFGVVHEGELVATVALPVPGTHNARNACAALVTAVLLGASVEASERALGRYAGVARRYQFRGVAGGVTFVDDYAHLPTEVAAAVATAQIGGWQRIVVVFQPHRYSRTAALAPTFADAFQGADVLVVTDIFPASEAPRPGVTGKLIVDAVLASHPTARVAWLPGRADVLTYLLRTLRPGDLCLTLGAGDLTSMADDVIASLDHA